MDENEILKAFIRDKMRESSSRSMITYTKFLDMNQQSIFLKQPKNSETIMFLYGGYEDAERKIGVFVPAFFEIKDKEEFAVYDNGKPLTLLKIEKDKFSDFTHRDYLGSLMSLGLKRDTVGDIIVTDKGAFFVVLDEIASYIEQNLFKIKHGSCKITKADFSELTSNPSNTENIFMTVASLRLDNVLTAAFGISRKQAVADIHNKKVFVNDVLAEKADLKIHTGSKIVLRGKGKAILAEQNGLSKKEREKIVIKKYI